MNFRKYAKRGLLGFSLLAIPVAIRLERPIEAKPTPANQSLLLPKVPVDVRTVRLKNYLASLNSPVRDMAEDFVHAADDNHIDWRLLPSIAVIESSGGKYFKNNNILGWGNGDIPFPTIRAGIHEVAFKLGRLPVYRNKNSYQKLRVYNKNPEYAKAVSKVMTRISPAAELRSVNLLTTRDRQFQYGLN